MVVALVLLCATTGPQEHGHGHNCRYGDDLVGTLFEHWPLHWAATSGVSPQEWIPSP